MIGWYQLDYTPKSRNHYDQVKSWLHEQYGSASIYKYSILEYPGRNDHTNVDICFHSNDIWTHFRLVWLYD